MIEKTERFLIEPGPCGILLNQRRNRPMERDRTELFDSAGAGSIGDPAPARGWQQVRRKSLLANYFDEDAIDWAKPDDGHGLAPFAAH